ncbi:MAG: hypothetical protein VX438_14290, partial [Planctomycetota bacterium]|nr:hypothetical protein [Planctomycetota bacterium]
MRIALAKPVVTGILLLGNWFLLIHGVSPASAQESSLQTQYQGAYQVHRQALLNIAEKCKELGRNDLAEYTRSWVPQKDPARDYFYLLPTHRRTSVPELSGQTGQFWFKAFQNRRKAYSAELLRLARLANTRKDYSLAFQLLHECLFQDPENTVAQKILGASSSPMKVRVNRYRQADRLLPGGSITKYETDHFVLYTTIDQEIAEKAIQNFEQWYGVWRQHFYSYWASATWMSRRFEADVKTPRRSKKFKVVLYPNRQEYLEKLKPTTPGIEVSLGYYLF